MTKEIQPESPRRSPTDGIPDIGIGIPDIRMRKPRRWIRPWVIGTACFLSGAISHGVLNLYAPIHGRAQMAGNACFEGLWYTVGLLLILVDARMDENPTTRRTKFLVCGSGAIVAFVLVVVSVPP